MDVLHCKLVSFNYFSVNIFFGKYFFREMRVKRKLLGLGIFPEAEQILSIAESKKIPGSR